MPTTFPTLEEARDSTFAKQKSRIRGLKDPIGYSYSNLKGEPFGNYIFKNNEGFWISDIYPVDLEQGYLINPKANLFGGGKTTMAPFDLKHLSAISLTLLGGWHDAEIGYRQLFSLWSRRLNVPIFVQPQSDHYPWYRRFWTHTAIDCETTDRKDGTETCRTVNAQ